MYMYHIHIHVCTCVVLEEHYIYKYICMCEYTTPACTNIFWCFFKKSRNHLFVTRKRGCIQRLFSMVTFVHTCIHIANEYLWSGILNFELCETDSSLLLLICQNLCSFIFSADYQGFLIAFKAKNGASASVFQSTVYGKETLHLLKSKTFS